MAQNPLQKTRRRPRRGSLMLLVLLTFAAMLGLAYAQSSGTGFSLNSPASFPVDI